MAQPFYTPAPLTVHDYLALPDSGPRYQLVDGDLHIAPAPSLFHQRISREIELLIGTWLKENPVGEILHAPVDLFLTETNVYQPDILFVSKDRSHLFRENGVHGAPDLVVEILSPSTSHLDLGAKKRVYARCGVVELWVVDPIDRKFIIYNLRRSETEPEATWGDGDYFQSKFFPGLNIEVALLFCG